jgi:hypothetical protein
MALLQMDMSSLDRLRIGDRGGVLVELEGGRAGCQH